MSMPTEQQVYQYVCDHPGCGTKDIAKHLGMPPQHINVSSPGYRGIYKMKELIRTENYKHYPMVQNAQAQKEEEDEKSCLYDEELPSVPDTRVDELLNRITALEALVEILSKSVVYKIKPKPQAVQ